VIDIEHAVVAKEEADAFSALGMSLSVMPLTTSFGHANREVLKHPLSPRIA
jgi:hypothetical protein